jgi:hypothetical protein
MVLSAKGIAEGNRAPPAGVNGAKMKCAGDFILAKILRGEPRNAARGSAPSLDRVVIQPIAWRLAAEYCPVR